VMGWSLGKMIRTHLKPRSFSSRSHGNLTEDVNRFEFGVIETPRFIELYASYGFGPALRPVGCETSTEPTARPALCLSRRHALLEGPLDRRRRPARMPKRGRFRGCGSPAHAFSRVTRHSYAPRWSFCTSVPAVTVARSACWPSGAEANLLSNPAKAFAVVV
jgi:hypothetical protein